MNHQELTEFVDNLIEQINKQPISLDRANVQCFLYGIALALSGPNPDAIMKGCENLGWKLEL